ncbi:serine/threonine-protein phosphatase [Marinomonas rhodophyticola]|uniref:Serine/threonine-protein phosphatase n=1 Tax=Marinomonas rhodophyticola TaxID=2992803 RepID=A0ABT3KBV9_9GAMM|nr:serine/threonine-protein phosphatase [Marinomonas sp. KJ51-3]MCW4627587.1 serine/threonine-protein phosphatase [Marinomonas sp. KJ51-3]
MKTEPLIICVQTTCHLGYFQLGEFDADLQHNTLHLGDTLIIVSDGVLELKNDQNEMLGDDNVKALIASSYAEKDLILAQQMTEKKLTEYQGESVQLDDITLVALRSACLQ